MKIREIITEMGVGGIAMVAQPMGSMQRRKPAPKKRKKTTENEMGDSNVANDTESLRAKKKDLHKLLMSPSLDKETVRQIQMHLAKINKQLGEGKDKPETAKFNPVAKNMNTFNKASTHKDKKKASRRGDRKHKGRSLEESYKIMPLSSGSNEYAVFATKDHFFMESKGSKEHAKNFYQALKFQYEEENLLDEGGQCDGPTKKASSTSKGKKWMQCVKQPDGSYKRVHWGQKGVKATGDSGNTKRKKSFRARHDCKNAKKGTAKAQACKDW